MEFITTKLEGQVATITLNRPDKRNAMHAAMVVELLTALKQFAHDESRVLVLNGNGDHFCAGGDIHWMQQVAEGSDDQNYDDAQLLADLFYALYTFPKPTIVMAHGAVMGGGLGLLAACDIALAADNAVFCFSEVKIGLVPSMISPYAIAAIGERAAHYYFVTAEKFNAEEALRIGLLHRVYPKVELPNRGTELVDSLLKNSPNAMHKAKDLIRAVAKQKITEALVQKTAEHLAELRKTPQAQEGLKAFMEKRTARW